MIKYEALLEYLEPLVNNLSKLYEVTYTRHRERRNNVSTVNTEPGTVVSAMTSKEKSPMGTGKFPKKAKRIHFGKKEPPTKKKATMTTGTYEEGPLKFINVRLTSVGGHRRN